MGIMLHPMADQTSFRLPTTLAQALARAAEERGIPKSQLVREALERYLAGEDPLLPGQVRERSAAYLGALDLDECRAATDPTARLIRKHNWRP